MSAIRFAGLLGPALSGLLALSACAKISEPQPPQVLVPKPAADLSLRQVADRILLSVSMPMENTNGSRAPVVGEVEIFRLMGDRGQKAVLPQDLFLAQAQRIQSIRAEALGRYLKDGALHFEDSSFPDPETLYGSGFRYAVRFINRKNQTAGLSNQIFVAPVAIPVAPEGISSTVERDQIRLSWKPPETNVDGSVPARIAGYNVYRSMDAGSFPAAPLNGEPLPAPAYADRRFEFDTTYYYAVTVVGSRDELSAESLPSAPHAVAARDTFAPGMPKSPVSVVEGGMVMLMWGAPDDGDLAGYRVYRKEEQAPAPSLLQNALITSLNFRDAAAQPAKKYEYSIAAVDTHGNEGPAAIVIVEVR
jgi:hypothetical protein